ncbi:MAG: beta-glucosidase [Myxococcota bacterium]
MDQDGSDGAAEGRIDGLLAEMTLDEKVAMVAGVDMWRTPGVPRLGVPGLKVTDGPHGARGESFTGAQTAVAFPCATAMGATWNADLVGKVGGVLAEETRSKGAQVLLAPTVNLHRTPVAGRNFECYSEDPELTAVLAIAYIRGLQEAGVGASLKHFVCNDSEFERHTISSEVDERPLRELYLYPFEAAVAEARPWSVMSSYNKINGTWASENGALLNDLLKGSWGFDGFVVSDWFGTNETVAVANGGLDLEMPGPARHFGAKLREALDAGEVSESVLDDKVRRLLRATARAGLLDAPPPEGERSIDRPEHREVALQVARESIVLLTNRAATLPFGDDVKSVAVVGPNADPAVSMGGGSSRVTPHYAISPLEGIRDRLGASGSVVHEIGCTRDKRLRVLDSSTLEPLPGEDGRGWRLEFFDGLEPGGDPVLTKAGRRGEWSWFGAPSPELDPSRFSVRASAVFVAPESGTYTFGLASAGLARLLVDGRLVVDNWTDWERGDTFYGMGSVERRGEVTLREGAKALVEVEFSKEKAPMGAGIRVGLRRPVPHDAIERAAEAARRADAAVVVVGLDGDWESEGFDRPDLELPGRQAELVRAVATANPRTVVVLNAGSPLRVERFVDEVGAILQLWYPGQEGGRALAEVLFGDVCPSGRLPTTFPRRLEDTPAHLSYPGEFGRVRYGEGIFIGYRYTETVDRAPRFAFGHGLSYSRFELGPIALDRPQVEAGQPVDLEIPVTNVGDRLAAEVVQVYLRFPESRVARPALALGAFGKVELAPGATHRLRLRVPARALAHWDPDAGHWVHEEGPVELVAGASCRDLRQTSRLTVGAA